MYIKLGEYVNILNSCHIAKYKFLAWIDLHSEHLRMKGIDEVLLFLGLYIGKENLS